ncbi:type IV pilus twitching motility protein PilT [Planctomycetota bacterium]
MAIKQTRELECLIQEAYDKKASFLYVMPNEPPAFRIKNSIERIDAEPFTPEQIADIARAALGEDRLKGIGLETGQVTTLCGLPDIVDGRMSVAKVSGDYAITIYLLPTSLSDVESVRIPEAILEASLESRGLVLFSGPTGSGKTTSLFSTMDYINSQKSCTICANEYMITYPLTSKKALIQQREVGVDAPDMLTAISTSLSQGADVLMVGELRNVEEINMCIMISQNLFVLTQLHADTPEAAIQRMIDIFPEDSVTVPRRILSEKLRGVCAQVLLERADGKGRVAAYGVLIPDEKMRKAIAQGRDVFDRKTPLPQGCRTIAQDIENLCREGIIDQETRDKALIELKQ